MIRTFRDKVKAAVFVGRPVKKLPRDILKRSREKLDMLHHAQSIDDLRSPPANRLERLEDNRRGQWSIRINRQWRVCFRWKEGMPMKLRLSTTTEEGHCMNIDIENLEHMDFSDVVDADADADLIPPTRPGDILRHDFLEPLHMSANALARNLRVPTNRVTSILSGTRRVSADTALRLSRYFGTSAAFWLNLQASYDLELAKRRAGERIRHEVDPRAA